MASSTIVKYILDIKTGKARSEVEKTERSVTALNKDLDRTEKEAKKAVQSMQKMETAKKAIGAASKGVLALAAAFTAASVVAFKFSKDIVDATNDLNDMANKTGLATSTLQGLNLAFTSSGQEASAAAEGLAQLPAKMSEMATEGSRANKAANRLGISLVDLEGTARSNDDVFKDVVSTIQSIDDPSQRARVAFELLGESAGKLNQAIGAGAEFSNFIDIAQKWGVDTGPEASASAAEFQQNLALLQMVFAGTRQEIGNASGSVIDFGGAILLVTTQMIFFRGAVEEGTVLFDAFGDTVDGLAEKMGGWASVIVGQVVPSLGFLFAAFNAINDDLTDGKLGEKISEGLGLVAKDLKKSNDEVLEFLDLSRGIDAGNKAVEEFLKTREKLLSGGIVSRPAFDVGGPGGGGSAIETIKDMSDAYAEMDRIIEGTKVLDQFQQLEKAFADNEAKIMEFVDATGDTEKGMEALVAITDQYENSVRDANEELDRLAANKAAQKQAQEFEKLSEQILNAGSALSTLLTGDVFGTVGQFMPKITDTIQNAIVKMGAGKGAGGGTADIARLVDPIINAVTGVFGAVSQIGAAGITNPNVSDRRARELAVESIEERVQNQARAFAIGLQVLPELLIEVMPGLLADFGSILVDALMMLPSLIGQAVVNAFETWGQNRRERREERRERTRAERIEDRQERRENIGQSIVNGLNTIFNAFRLESGGRIPFAESGLRFTGDSMGMAVLHPGEFVVPRTGQAPQEVQRDLGARSGGGGITINVSAEIVEQNAIDELVRRIESRFLDFGGGTSPLFGGA